MRIRSILVAAALLATLPLVPAPAARADHSQPPQNLALMDYTPIGYYGPPDEVTALPGSATVPNPSNGPPALNDPNPSGKWVAYDTNVWEALTLPSRHPGDNCNSLPPDERSPDCLNADMDDDTTDPVARTGYTGYSGPNGTSNVHGTCPPDPEFVPWGLCFNNQLEYLDYYEHSMETLLADFGGTVHRYGFESPGGGLPRGVALAASAGQAYNIAAVVPGTDHPEETVLVSGHYDFTDSGPAAAWDSAEGHTEVMRMAYIMADYWRKTGTRPSATIKFIPWDSEEAGTFGSADYVANNIPPGEEDKVRAYFNVDPCAGAYPAYQEGTNDQVTEVMQLANPDNFEDEPQTKARIEAFNARAETIIDDVLNRLDDRLTRPTGEVPIFVSNQEAAAGADDRGPLGGAGSDRGKIVTAVGGLAIFTSDYRNFEAEGIPIFNFFPDYFGPHADLTPADGGTKGLEILHTNNDNLTRINRLASGLTSPGNVIDPTGTFAAEGWAKGMEFCAQVESQYMLQPEMAGAQTSNTNPVAYYEALPNEAIVNQQVNFDANGSYQYSDAATRTLQPDSALTYQWDFGDGTTATGKVVQHAYAEVGRYTSKLTVTGAGGTTDTMTIPVVVIGSNFLAPVLDQIPASDAEDGNFPLNWKFEGDTEGFSHFGVEESSDFRGLLTDEAEDITKNWNVTPPSASQIQPWQHSDSSTDKFFDNAHRSGERSFWTGFSPPFPQPPTTVPGTSIMTLKNPITVPAQGEPELAYWSFFRNESDDSAQVQVALTTGSTPAEQLEWTTVDSFSDATNTCVGTSPSGVTDTDFENRRASLGEFKGKQILVRFVYVSGPTNPALSQPCGWYVDDISVHTGTWSQIGTTKETRFQVTNRPNGTRAYRVKGIYKDGIPTAGSNVEIVQITKSTAGGVRCPVKFKGNRVIGTVGRDILVGTPGRDVLCGGKKNDTLRARGGKDVLIGGKGKDVLRGGGGKDLLRGGQGNDILAGGAGRDTLRGGGGRDLLRGGAKKDKCIGGGGKDRERAC